MDRNGPLAFQSGAAIETEDRKGNTALCSITSSGEVELLKLALQKSHCTQEETKELVLCAVHYKQLDCLTLLLQQNFPPDAVDSDGNTAVMWAAGRSNGIGMQRSLSILKMLIKFGANVNCPNKKSFTPLMAASLITEVEAVRVLLNAGADINAIDCKGETALMKAVDANALQVIKVLLNANADVNIANTVGLTALMRAPSIEVAELLLDRNADTTLTDIDGFTALHRHVENDKWEIVQVLIEYGCPIEAKNKEGLTSLQLSVRRKSYCCAALLFDVGANPETSGKNSGIVHEALLPWDYFNTYNIFSELDTWALWKEMITYTQNYRESTKKILKRLSHYPSCDFNSKGQDGVTPLMLAVASDDEWAVTFFVDELHCDCSLKDDEARTILHYAARTGNLRIINYLIYKGCPANIEDVQGNLPIYYAAYYGHLPVVLALILDFAFYMQR